MVWLLAYKRFGVPAITVEVFGANEGNCANVISRVRGHRSVHTDCSPNSSGFSNKHFERSSPK